MHRFPSPLERAERVLQHPTCMKILEYLYAQGATASHNRIYITQIERDLGINKGSIWKYIVGGKNRKALLKGFVHYGDKGEREGLYLLEAGIAAITTRNPQEIAAALSRRLEKGNSVRQNGVPYDLKAEGFPSLYTTLKNTQRSPDEPELLLWRIKRVLKSENALKVIRALYELGATSHKNGVSLTKLAAKANLPVSTVYRLTTKYTYKRKNPMLRGLLPPILHGFVHYSQPYTREGKYYIYPKWLPIIEIFLNPPAKLNSINLFDKDLLNNKLPTSAANKSPSFFVTCNRVATFPIKPLEEDNKNKRKPYNPHSGLSPLCAAREPSKFEFEEDKLTCSIANTEGNTTTADTTTVNANPSVMVKVREFNLKVNFTNEITEENDIKFSEVVKGDEKFSPQPTSPQPQQSAPCGGGSGVGSFIASEVIFENKFSGEITNENDKVSGIVEGKGDNSPQPAATAWEGEGDGSWSFAASEVSREDKFSGKIADNGVSEVIGGEGDNSPQLPSPRPQQPAPCQEGKWFAASDVEDLGEVPDREGGCVVGNGAAGAGAGEVAPTGVGAASARSGRDREAALYEALAAKWEKIMLEGNANLVIRFLRRWWKLKEKGLKKSARKFEMIWRALGWRERRRWKGSDDNEPDEKYDGSFGPNFGEELEKRIGGIIDSGETDMDEVWEFAKGKWDELATKAIGGRICFIPDEIKRNAHLRVYCTGVHEPTVYDGVSVYALAIFYKDEGEEKEVLLHFEERVRGAGEEKGIVYMAVYRALKWIVDMGFSNSTVEVFVNDWAAAFNLRSKYRFCVRDGVEPAGWTGKMVKRLVDEGNQIFFNWGSDIVRGLTERVSKIAYHLYFRLNRSLLTTTTIKIDTRCHFCGAPLPAGSRVGAIYCGRDKWKVFCLHHNPDWKMKGLMDEIFPF
ncbi:hypothetical protein B0813_002999 [Candidatus Fervidibacteria bacterium JGI MDM2 SSWTFF-3-K9]